MSSSRKFERHIRNEMYKSDTLQRHSSNLADKEAKLDSFRDKVDMTSRALLECLYEMGITREELELKIKEIRERGWTVNPPSLYKLCPKCGKKIFDYSDREFEATCMYCGTVVGVYPGDVSPSED